MAKKTMTKKTSKPAELTKEQQQLQHAESDNTLRALLTRARPSIEQVIPKHLSAERLIKVALVACSKSDKLKECTPHSVLQSVMIAAELGLDCGGALGSAYLVPFWSNGTKSTECQLIVGYRGLVELARRSGDVQSIEVRAAFSTDPVFFVEFGSESKIVHKPSLTETPAEENLIGCYCIAKFKDGSEHVEYMPKGEIDGIRNRSKAGQYGPWKSDYVQMAKKTVIRRAAKLWPLSPDMAKAIAVEDNDQATVMDSNLAGLLPAVVAPEPETRTEGLRAALAASADQASSEPVEETEAGSEPATEPDGDAGPTHWAGDPGEGGADPNRTEMFSQ